MSTTHSYCSSCYYLLVQSHLNQRLRLLNAKGLPDSKECIIVFHGIATYSNDMSRVRGNHSVKTAVLIILELAATHNHTCYDVDGRVLFPKKCWMRR